MPWLCVVCVFVVVLGNTKLPLLPAVLLNCLDSLGVCWLLHLALVLLLSTCIYIGIHLINSFLLEAELIFLLGVVVEYEY